MLYLLIEFRASNVKIINKELFLLCKLYKLKLKCHQYKLLYIER